MKRTPMTNEQLCVLAQKGEEAARSLLLENNMGFIRSTANSMYVSMALAESGLSIDQDDLTQEGSLGLLDAIGQFAPDKKVKFLTYAAPAIRNAMIDLVRSERAKYEYRMTVSENEDDNGLKRIYLDKVLSGEERMLRIEAIADPYVKTPEQIYIEAETMQELYAALEKLPDRGRTYLLYRYGFTDDIEHPLIGAAVHFNLSENRAKCTEKQALKLMRQELQW